ncbi:MAG: putative O-glycosylation ligase, exosortase A system-associated, partial [Pseudomonadota bacterium]
MRDVLVFMLVLGSLPMIVMRPWFGIIMWCWLSYMNPHRLAWGFAFDFPFAQVVALTTMASIVLSREKKYIEFTPLVGLWVVWVLWMNVTTYFALDDTWAKNYDRMIKTMLFGFLTVLLMNDEKRVRALVWVTVISLGFFGVKGGIFSILSGGNYLVWGPPGSFIEGNNELGLALVMTIPMMYYLFQTEKHVWVRRGALIMMASSMLAALTTHSRGAFIAMAAMVVFLWAKSRKKMVTAVILLAALPAILWFMPEHWIERMESIQNYKQDESAMGRINAWMFAWNLALDHPMVGGGFDTFTPRLFMVYAPDPTDFHDAHSIYFEVLAEHGFVGLGIFLALGGLALIAAGHNARVCRKVPELAWMSDLNKLIQVSLVGYAVGGA